MGLHLLRVIGSIGLVLTFAACAAGASQIVQALTTPSPGLTLAWQTSTQTGSSSPAANLGVPGSVTVNPSGSSPYQGAIIGSCATLAQATASAFVINVSSGFCVLVVQDGSARFRALALRGTPPRAFLGVTPTGLDDPSGTVHLSVGSTLMLAVDEPLVGSSFNAPYSAAIQGSCVAMSSSTSPLNGAASFSLTATTAGQCVALFADSAGQSTMLNFTVS